MDVDETILTNMAKNIGSMFLTNGQIDEAAKLLKSEYFNEDEDEKQNDEKKIEAIGKNMIKKFNSFVKNDYKLNNYKQLIIEGIFEKDIKKSIKLANGNSATVYGDLCAYYEYMQFKRGIFKCTKIGYDDGKTGRVTEIKFEFSGSLK